MRRKARKRSGRAGKIAKVLGEYKRGTLKSGSKHGPPVKDRKQAVAIGLSEARQERARERK
jgi:hypothetical protein